MIEILVLVSMVLVLMFGFVIFFGAPYLPTLKKQQEEALDLLDLQPGQLLLELGSGDGRLLRMAADRGISVIGYEINPILFLISKISCIGYGDRIQIKLANFWSVELPGCDGIYVFLLDKYMERLNNKIIQEIRGKVTLVSFAFPIKSKKPITDKAGLYLYKYDNK